MQEAEPAQRKMLLKETLTQFIRDILNLNPEQMIKPKQGFYAMGMDSLTAMEFKNRLQSSIGSRFHLPMSFIFDYPNFSAVIQYFETTLFPSLDQKEDLPEGILMMIPRESQNGKKSLLSP